MKNVIKTTAAALALSATASLADGMTEGGVAHYAWTEGAFEGEYRITLLPDGKFRGEGLAGAEKGLDFIQDVYHSSEVSEGIHLISWLETKGNTAGYTVTVIVDSAGKTVHGVVSNETAHYPLKGALIEFSTGN